MNSSAAEQGNWDLSNDSQQFLKVQSVGFKGQKYYIILAETQYDIHNYVSRYNRNKNHSVSITLE